MDPKIKKSIGGRISALPLLLQQQLLFSPWKAVLNNLALRYSLTEEQNDLLITEVFLILSGLEPISNFRTNLVEELDIPYDLAIKISYDTNLNIFNPVIDILKQIEPQIKSIDEAEEGDAPEENAEPEPEKVENKNKDIEEELRNKFRNTTHPDLNPEHLIPDHDEMEREDGTPHLHSQSVMPRNQSEISSGNFMPMPKKAGVQSFSSAIDQKLSQVSNAGAGQRPSAPAPQKPKPAPGVDPYREPIN